MEIIVYFIPFLISILLLIFFKKEMVWWEYVVLIIPSVLLTLVTQLIMTSANAHDIEYHGDYITKVRHYDPWDEWITQRCTRSVPAGTDSDGNTIYRTETYDCSYRKYHPDNWSYFDSRGNEHMWYFTETQFDYVKNRFKTPSIFVDMNRRYYRLDGDAQDYLWDGRINTAQTITTEHSYKNKVKASNSIFKYSDITKKEAKKLGLFEYPEISDVWGLDQNPILVADSLNLYIRKSAIDSVKYVNGRYGRDKQFRTFILIFDGTKNSVEISEMQKGYWQGGNKNEIVICLGCNNKGEVLWVNAFSWEDAPILAVGARNWWNEHSTHLDFKSFSEWLKTALNEWERKEFADFEYIKVQLKQWQNILLLVLTIVANIVISILLIVNDKNNHHLV